MHYFGALENVMPRYHPEHFVKGTVKYMVNPFPNKPLFLCVNCSTSLLKTVLKNEKLLLTSNFSFSHSVFYLFGELLLCTLSVWKSQKFVIWEKGM